VELLSNEVVLLSLIALEFVLLIQAFLMPHHVELQLDLPVFQNNGKLEQLQIFIPFSVDFDPAPKISEWVVEVKAGILERVPSHSHRSAVLESRNLDPQVLLRSQDIRYWSRKQR